MVGPLNTPLWHQPWFYYLHAIRIGCITQVRLFRLQPLYPMQTVCVLAVGRIACQSTCRVACTEFILLDTYPNPLYKLKGSDDYTDYSDRICNFYRRLLCLLCQNIWLGKLPVHPLFLFLTSGAFITVLGRKIANVNIICLWPVKLTTKHAVSCTYWFCRGQRW